MLISETTFRDQVRQLAAAAFQHRLISGFGDGEYPDRYQIIYQGRPRILSLPDAHLFLSRLLLEYSGKR